MNIGMISDLAQTGFGRVGRELGRRFIEAGHDIRVIAINFAGREGEVARTIAGGRRVKGEDLARAWDAVGEDPVLSRAIPAGINGDGMGHDLTEPLVAGQLVRDWRPDVMLLIADPVAAMYRLASDGGALGSLPTFNYVPIEGRDLSSFYRAIWERVGPVAMSRFGKTELDKLLGRLDVPYIPHGISPSFYRITPERPATTPDGEEVTSRADAKGVFGLQDRTVILRTDRYVERKAYPEFFEVVRRVVSERPEVVFVIHCSPVDEGGVMANLLADLPGASFDGKGRWTHSQVILTRAHDTFRGLSDAELNILINAADVVASTSRSEGFGLTLAEAAACGVPVVATRFGAIGEAVGPGGLLVEPSAIVPTHHGHWWSQPDIDGITDAVMALIEDRKLREDLGSKGEAYVARFDWDAAALAFIRLMEDKTEWLP